MPTVHRVRQGECLASIGARYGVSRQAIWDDPGNDSLRERRKSPHVLKPGDDLTIPDKESRDDEVPTGAMHTFEVDIEPVHLRLALKTGGGDPLASKRYRLEIGSLVREGQTDGDGKLEEEIPPEAEQGTLTLFLTGEDDGPRRVLPLRIGHLDPLDDKQGLRSRLTNLGLHAPDDDHSLSKVVHAFQKAHDLDAHGDLDDATKSKLHDLHGA
ncbi:MAG: LysM domain-containing protein [Polyangiaceae bacterium]